MPSFPPGVVDPDALLETVPAVALEHAEPVGNPGPEVAVLVVHVGVVRVGSHRGVAAQRIARRRRAIERVPASTSPSSHSHDVRPSRTCRRSRTAPGASRRRRSAASRPRIAGSTGSTPLQARGPASRRSRSPCRGRSCRLSRPSRAARVRKEARSEARRHVRRARRGLPGRHSSTPTAMSPSRNPRP